MTKSNNTRRKRHFFPAQGIVEFALVIPILLTLLFGIFEVGRAFWIYSAVTSASREAARLGSSVGDNGSGTPNYLDCAAIRTAAKRIGGPGQVVDADITISYDDGPSGNSIGNCPVSPDAVQLGDRVVVTVIGHFDPAPAIPLFTFPTFDITSVSRRTIIKAIDLSSTAAGTAGATSTAANTATPSDTPLPSNTPANTNTPTNTLAPSDTPIPSDTPTPTETPACSVSGGSLQYDADDIRWNLTNNGSATDRISRVYFEWIDSPSSQKYDALYFGGSRIHSGDDNSPATNLTSGWDSNSERRDIDPSETKELNIDFKKDHPEPGILILVEFESGCSVSVDDT